MNPTPTLWLSIETELHFRLHLKLQGSGLTGNNSNPDMALRNKNCHWQQGDDDDTTNKKFEARLRYDAQSNNAVRMSY